MHLVVLAVPGCPSAQVLDQRLERVLEDHRDVTVSHHVIDDAGEAARLGMHGSPTLLVDGIDPFAEPGQRASVSCRLYRHRHGSRAEGAPSVRKLRQAISHPVTVVADTGDDGWLDALGRVSGGRIAPSEGGLRAVHQAVLRSIAATGTPPRQDLLDQAAGPFDSRQVLAELAAGDYLCLDHDGQITAAYPFSVTVTPHTVEIRGGAVAYSMCAIDALGTSAMLGTPVLIRSADSATGEAISVAVHGGAASWEPDTAVVYAGRTASSCTGPSATVCCGYMNFFTSHATAATWTSARPDITGGILSQAKALEVGHRIFGPLLR
ncbi:MAG: alkylmercury lyase family protein [Streptosporangiaceae bacterium]